jgi:rod shape-determining protein MreD
MKFARILTTVLVALGLQMALARYAIGGRWVFDLVLVGTVYAALYWGAVGGILAGTLGGLVQDALSGGIIGVGSLAKTVVGFAVGVIGGQFVVARPLARTAILAGASVLHRLIVLGVFRLIDQRWPSVSWIAMLEETGLNAFCGWMAFQATEGLPGALRRGRASRRGGLRRREW